MATTAVTMATWNSSNDEYDQPVPGIEEFRHVANAFLTIFSLLGVVLNVCVIKYSRRLHGTTGDLTHCFVCSFACADLIVCCFAQPFEFILHKLSTASLVALPDWLCRCQHAVYWLGYSASGLSLTLLNLDKLLFFKWPLHYGLVGTKKMAIISISTCWLICGAGSMVMVAPTMLRLAPEGDCATLEISPQLYIAYSIVFSIIPVLSSAIVSIYLSKLVQNMRRNMNGYSSALLNEHTVQQRLRAMAFIFITTAWTFVALIPFRLFNIVRIYRASEWYAHRGTLVMVHWLGYSLLYILSLNPVVNPCLTLITYAPYKNLFSLHAFKIKKAIYSMMGRRAVERRESEHTSGRYSLTQSDWV